MEEQDQLGPREQECAVSKSIAPNNHESLQAADAEEARQMKQASVRAWLLRKEEELAARRKAEREQALLLQEQEYLQEQRREERSEEFRRLQEQRLRSAECRRKEFELESGLGVGSESMKQRFNSQLSSSKNQKVDSEQNATVVSGRKDCQVLLGRAIATYAKATTQRAAARRRPKSARAGRS